MRSFADDKIVADFDAKLSQAFNFIYKANGINHDAIADDTKFIFAKDAGRNEVQNILLLSDENGMPGIVAASVRTTISASSVSTSMILAFTFVAPLGSN